MASLTRFCSSTVSEPKRPTFLAGPFLIGGGASSPATTGAAATSTGPADGPAPRKSSPPTTTAVSASLRRLPDGGGVGELERCVRQRRQATWINIKLRPGLKESEDLWGAARAASPQVQRFRGPGVGTASLEDHRPQPTPSFEVF